MWLMYGIVIQERFFPIPPAAKLAIIRVIRVLLLLVSVLEKKFTRPFSAFSTNKQSALVIEFDASLSGIGIIVYHHPVPVGIFQASLSILHLGDDSGFQNLAEFVACSGRFKDLPVDGHSSTDDDRTEVCFASGR